jgi:hypothetical protein
MALFPQFRTDFQIAMVIRVDQCFLQGDTNSQAFRFAA